MAGRHRSELISGQTLPFAQTCKYSSPNGNCASEPGVPSIYYATWSTSGNCNVSYEYREMDDVVTPEFGKGVAKGYIFNNPMTYLYEKSTIPIVDVDMNYMLTMYGCTPNRWYNWREFTISGTRSIESLLGADSWITGPSIDVESLKDQAIAKAWSNTDQSEMLYLASLKELDQTVDGLTYIFKKVYRILRALHKEDLKLLRKEITPREMKEVYLNARYNLRPLAYDVKGFTSVINSAVEKAKRQTFRCNLSRSVSDSDILEKQIIHDIYRDMTTSFARVMNRKVSVRAGVLADVQPMSKNQLLGLDKIAQTTWDLIPFSFIVDWFCNAGDIVGAWSPNIGTKALASWVMVTDVTVTKATVMGTNFTCTPTSSYHYANQSASVGIGTMEKTVITKVRTPDYSRPVFPSFKVNLDPLKLLDLGLILGNVKQFRYASQ